MAIQCIVHRSLVDVGSNAKRFLGRSHPSIAKLAAVVAAASNLKTRALDLELEII